jgi:hypothetical protein
MILNISNFMYFPPNTRLVHAMITKLESYLFPGVAREELEGDGRAVCCRKTTQG